MNSSLLIFSAVSITISLLSVERETTKSPLPPEAVRPSLIVLNAACVVFAVLRTSSPVPILVASKLISNVLAGSVYKAEIPYDALNRLLILSSTRSSVKYKLVVPSVSPSVVIVVNDP